MDSHYVVENAGRRRASGAVQAGWTDGQIRDHYETHSAGMSTRDAIALYGRGPYNWGNPPGGNHLRHHDQFGSVQFVDPAGREYVFEETVQGERVIHYRLPRHLTKQANTLARPQLEHPMIGDVVDLHPVDGGARVQVCVRANLSPFSGSAARRRATGKITVVPVSQEPARHAMRF